MPNSDTSPRFRFAPSPTGTLHVGGARTAILNWLLARRSGGAFVLRVEDTDVERNVAGAEEKLLEDLRWLGLDWDEGPGAGGAFGPYRQSERGESYRAAATRLLERDRAYFCSCPPSAEAGAEHRPRCPCARRPSDGAWREGESLRFRADNEKPLVVRDAIRGEVTFPGASAEDFVLLRSNGRATYNFAAALDDAAMRITHVVRGADHLNNTPKQVAVYAALELPIPLFAHIPLILGPDRQKLSKRHGATSVAEHRRLGYLPEALVNYLSLLSWSSASGEEFLTLERLIAEVDLGRVGASDAVYDPEKLRWLSHRHLQTLSERELLERVGPFLGDEARAMEREQLSWALEVVRERISVLSEVDAELAPFRGPRTPEQLEAREALRTEPATVSLLAAAAARVEELAAWRAEEIGAAFREVGKELGIRGRGLFRPLRLALTGEEQGPDLARIALVLGQKRAASLLRLEPV
jgi:nondiscriminating glutamyl-tRNA synthetase